MSKFSIDDKFLYIHMTNVENILIGSLPKEEELFHVFSKQFEQKMNKLIRQEKRTPFMKSFIDYGKKAAIIFLIFITVAFATTMNVEAYRVKFLEVVTEVWEEFTSIFFKSKENINDGKLIPIIPGNIPKDFGILEEIVNDYICSIVYTNENNEEIFYEQRVLSQGEVLLDTENVQIETIEIGNQTIFMFTNKGVNQLYWRDDFYSYTLISSINFEDIIKIAKSILG